MFLICILINTYIIIIINLNLCVYVMCLLAIDKLYKK